MDKLIDEHTTHANVMYKAYSWDSLSDVERDISEAFDGDFNEIINQIPTDEQGMMTGTGRFVVSVEWHDDPKCCVCGTTENLHKDGWYGHRCDSVDCMVF